MDPHCQAGFVVDVDGLLPVAELMGQAGVCVGLGSVGVVLDPREQPQRSLRLSEANVGLLKADRLGGLGAGRDELFLLDAYVAQLRSRVSCSP